MEEKTRIKNLYKLFKEHKEGRWIMETPNVESLYVLIKSYPIKRVLDLGTGIGCSAAIIAQTLLDKGETDFHIDSVEQFDKCIKIANELIPLELKKYITIHKSNALLWTTEKIPYETFSIFETLPEGDYDLILNDGPAPWQEGENYIELPNATILKMLLEDKLKPGTLIAFDGRISSIATLERYFQDNFKLVMPTKNTDFNVIRRQDNLVLFYDQRLKVMRDSTYFKDYEKDNLSCHF